MNSPNKEKYSSFLQYDGHDHSEGLSQKIFFFQKLDQYFIGQIVNHVDASNPPKILNVFELSWCVAKALTGLIPKEVEFTPFKYAEI